MILILRKKSYSIYDIAFYSKDSSHFQNDMNENFMFANKTILDSGVFGTECF